MTNTVKEILQGIIDGGQYSSYLYNDYCNVSSQLSTIKEKLLEEMQNVVVSSNEYSATLDHTTVIEVPYSYREGAYQTTKGEEFDECFNEAIANLCYDIGVVRDGSDFWTPSTC